MPSSAPSLMDPNSKVFNSVARSSWPHSRILALWQPLRTCGVAVGTYLPLPKFAPAFSGIGPPYGFYTQPLPFPPPEPLKPANLWYQLSISARQSQDHNEITSTRHLDKRSTQINRPAWVARDAPAFSRAPMTLPLLLRGSHCVKQVSLTRKQNRRHKQTCWQTTLANWRLTLTNPDPALHYKRVNGGARGTASRLEAERTNWSMRGRRLTNPNRPLLFSYLTHCLLLSCRV